MDEHETKANNLADTVNRLRILDGEIAQVQTQNLSRETNEGR